MTNYLCNRCGQCCYMEIPLTLLDIHRIATHLCIEERKAFKAYIQNRASSNSSLFIIQKTVQGACVFLRQDKKCSIQPAKPNACTFYNCALPLGKDVMPWTATCTDEEERAALWEQSVAAIVTKAYIEKNSAVWNNVDYYKALNSIRDNIVMRANQKIKLARDGHDRPLSMIYDCSACEKRGLCAEETPVTLDDIRRISVHLKISWKDFFRKKIMTEPSLSMGCMKLVRYGPCIFFREERHCTIEKVRPMHCRFRPCPMKTQTTTESDAFYLGSGTVEAQFRHQVAIAVTREYVATCGTRYKKRTMERLLNKMDALLGAHFGFERFCEKIAPYRYVDDTLMLVGSSALPVWS